VQVFRRAPADGDDGRLADAIVQRGVDGGEETVVGVEREVDGDLRLGCDRRGHLDIEHDFAVRVRVGAGDVGADAAVAGDAHRGDIGRGQAQGGEVGLQVGDAEAGPRCVVVLVEVVQFDDGDALAVAVETGREVVEGGDLRRGEAAICGVVG